MSNVARACMEPMEASLTKATSTTSALRVVIAGGGTGGHLYPGIAVAEAFQALVPNCEVRFIGSASGIEARVLPAEGWDVDLIEASRLRGGGLGVFLKGLWKLPLGILRCVGILRSWRPAIVVGVGGYASGAAMIAAAICRIPRVVQEQNAIPGMTNRVLGKIANRTYLSFPEAEGHFPHGKSVLVGNPIRKSICDALSAVETGREANAATSLNLLIVGGSQGARFLNETVPSLVGSLESAGIHINVIHQTGVADEEVTRGRYETSGLTAEVKPYISDMATAYSWADLVICRAGASTVAELTAVGLPALFVPFPYAAYDHQTANARAVVAAGGGMLFQQSDWEEDAVKKALGALISDGDALAEMGARSKEMGRPQAAENVVKDALGLLNISPQTGGQE
jgi:UDP-N-acetylglucosamine--N-acetylmuramyl-(pentapeptide) pyrophosphoryl-undecaprenol N-acetylglucosamine transferase